jgi:hypothetical protein
MKDRIDWLLLLIEQSFFELALHSVRARTHQR